MADEWSGYKNYDHYFDLSISGATTDFIEEIKKSSPKNIEVGKEKWWNIPASFDIETSSLYSWSKKRATMYLWALNINGSTIIGRTWSQFISIIYAISEALQTKKCKLIIYVHNLGYEFQFMRNWFSWSKVFAIKERRPIYAVLEEPAGIEFRCSYLLSNYALAYLGDNLIRKYKVKKDVGAVDYSVVRTTDTVLTETEIWYNIHDVQVVTSFIQEKIENEGAINTFPLTNTGYVRQYCRDYCFTQQQKEPKQIKKLKAKYHEQMESLQITSECEYDQLHTAFAGGFTHAAPSYSTQEVLENVGSADLASSYPAVMVTKKFPMARGVFIGDASIEFLENIIKSDLYCVIFTAIFHNIDPKFKWEHYISLSHCQKIENPVCNNGRVASASLLQTVIVDEDWKIIKEVYEWDEVELFNIRVYPAGYLPRPFILSILHLFKNKTSLKGVEGKETEYMVSKNMINSAYGMTVTAIIRDIFDYSNTGGWFTSGSNHQEELKRYNNSYNRFLFYGWGVWVTAHARANLWKAILEFGKDYVYSDTDSIKGVNFDDHKLFFDLYNMDINLQLRKMCNYWKIPFQWCEPLTPKGKKKMIGVWEIEDSYKKFKSIGAKRYIYEYEDGFLNFTISGVNKKYGVPHLLSEYANPKYSELYRIAYRPNSDEDSSKALSELLELHKKGEIEYDEIFENFNDGLYFPPEATGKQTLTYCDEPFCEVIQDYQGHKTLCLENSYIHMEPQGYYMSQTEQYKNFLRGYRDASI